MEYIGDGGIFGGRGEDQNFEVDVMDLGEVEVSNVVGSGEARKSPQGSWNKYWEHHCAQAGHRWSFYGQTCRRDGCNSRLTCSRDAVGAHMYVKHSRAEEVWIVPFCQGCNQDRRIWYTRKGNCWTLLKQNSIGVRAPMPEGAFESESDESEDDYSPVYKDDHKSADNSWPVGVGRQGR